MSRHPIASALVAGLFFAPSIAHAQLPDRLGPYVFGDDTASVRPSLFFQLQSRARSESGGALSWDHRVRRIRPIVRVAFFERRLTATLHVEAAPSAPELIDAWLEGRATPWLRLRAGQLKTPFTRYYQRSLIEQAVDWPLTSRFFGGERQLGVMAHGAHERSGLGYALGLFAGQNRRAAFARELARVYGESQGNPSSWLDPAPNDPPHAELVARFDHAGAHAGLRHTVSLSVAWDSAPVARRDWALRLAPELDLELGPMRVTFVAYAAFARLADGHVSLGGLGTLAVVAWRAHRHLELVVRYARVHLSPALLADARAYAEARHGELDGGSWQERFAHVGEEHAQHELSLAVNVLVIGRSLTWQTDVAWLRSERASGALDDVRLRAQLQLAF